MYRVNAMVPRTGPLDTNWCSSIGVDFAPSVFTSPITTAYVCLVRYDSNQLTALPVTAKLFLSLDSRIWWSTVSKAADRSSNMRHITSSFQMLVKCPFLLPTGQSQYYDWLNMEPDWVP